MCNCDPDELPLVLKVIRVSSYNIEGISFHVVVCLPQMKTENVEMDSLFRSEAQALHNQLILNLSSSPDQVLLIDNSFNSCIRLFMLTLGFERFEVIG